MNSSPAESSADIHLGRALLAFALYMLLIPAILFLAAGTTEWPMAWVYVCLLLVSTVGSRVMVYFKNPDALKERARFASSEDQLPQDRVLMLMVGSVGPVVMLVTPGLDLRFGWSPPVPELVQYTATVLVAMGYALAVWAMVANRFFSAVVRLQHDRGQTVVTSGPYGWVRHPAYAGSMISIFAMPFMLSSYWSLIPAILIGAATVYRTKLEDDMLQGGLAGYPEYAEQVRWRLLPGLW